MGISIAIATYNRASELERTLLSLEHVNRDDIDGYEILVINNNSTDSTAEVAERMAPRFGGRLRHILERRQGLSHARNRAVSEARHSIVAFLDDDVDLDVNWLRHLAIAYESGDYAAIGGRAYLVYPRARPGWLGERDEGGLTKVELGPEPRPAEADEIYGLNLSFRKSWINRVGGFRTDLGRVGTCLLSSEESELLERIADAGGRLLYEPSVVVGHRVAPERLRRRWFWARGYWGARGEVRRLPEHELTLRELFRKTCHVAYATRDLGRTMLSHSPWGDECFHQSKVLSERLGACVGLALRFVESHRDRLPNHPHSLSRRGVEPATALPSPLGSHPEVGVRDTAH